MVSLDEIKKKTYDLNVPDILLGDKRYELRFVKNADELDQVLKLRYDVFNLELGEGLDSSVLTGRDEDEFDRVCHHLIVIYKDTQQVIGTYRMQTIEMASKGFYSAAEFRIDQIPAEVLNLSVEVGRACIDAEHRNRGVLFLLWQGLAHYMMAMKKRYLFGCCSLTSQDPDEAKLLMDFLIEKGYGHPDFTIQPQEAFRCYQDGYQVQKMVEIKIPKLFQIYLNYNSMVCGPPAIDKEFKTIDYLVMMDIKKLDERSVKMFFGS
ncbi:MAG: GNAT family N-acetyltransferase [Calditrichaeota bacterium]|nr:GNAT family N-acetyltransferase [Calditrichota bacterium]